MESRSLPLMDAVTEAFAIGGPLSREQAGFMPRAGQTDMALAVAQTIETGGALVVEAGTGVGKTFAYLVPALLSGERVLVSTATKALQDQLFARDLPRLVQTLAVPVRVALLKGRSSYLCLHRLEQARLQPQGQSPHVARVLARMEVWAQATRSGDLAELPGLDERSPAIPLATSTRDNCLGTACSRFSRCHVQLARRDALAADVVVINHHLFFADMAVRESGMAELLPTTRVVVFDEAHQLNTTGVQFLGRQTGSGQWLDYCRDLLATALQQVRGLQDWPKVAAVIERAAHDLRLVVGAGAEGRRTWMGSAPAQVAPQQWSGAVADLVRAMRGAVAALDTVVAMSVDLARLHERAVRLLEALQHFSEEGGTDTVRWLEVGAQAVRLVEAPLDIAPQLRTLWNGAPREPSAWDDEEEPVSESPRSGRAWIFTSATLGDDAELRWFTEPCGLQDARVVRVPSPFDYPRQASLYIPLDLPRPADPAHTVQLARWAGDAIARLGGRTLVLTTTLRALQVMGDALQERFGPGSGIEVLVQGQGAKRLMMERFRLAGGEDAEDGASRHGCVLVASASFWEGFDVPGQALQLVIIDKLPFPPPGDPVIDARTQRLEAQGRSAFKEFSLPEAAVALQQGAGRLIRSETDQGVLVVADVRLATMGYGKRLIRALPAMRRLQSQAEFDAALDALRLTTASTTDRPCPGP